MKYLLTVLIALSFFALQACEGPAGPAGKDGSQGPAGQNAGFVYFEGFKDSLRCQTCHTADYDTTYRVVTKKVQYEMSGHRELGNYDRNTTQCAGCHTNEGFFERYNNGFANETFNINSPSGPMVKQGYPNSSPVGCFTCHSPHKRGDFSVRDNNQVNIYTLLKNQTTKVWNSTGESNLCVKCHQPRMTSTFLTSAPYSWQPDPNAAATDTAKIYTSRWNNHVSGEQSQTLLGFGGFEFVGGTYPSSPHKDKVDAKGLGCEDCHMATPIGNKGGGHTFKIGYTPEGSTTESFNFAGCNNTGCHSSNPITATGAKWKGVRDEIGAKITQLGLLMMDTTITKKWSLPKSGKAVAWVSLTTDGTDTTWSVANASSTSPLRILPAVKAGALWNFQQVVNEKSKGIHNTAYVRALLDASIAELNK
ncbi:MAG: hypothetical protein PHP42_07850 [Bacteroidota bacterium]|nr:hypothetical protein [Bacteroidota bacterium]